MVHLLTGVSQLLQFLAVGRAGAGAGPVQRTFGYLQNSGPGKGKYVEGQQIVTSLV